MEGAATLDLATILYATPTVLRAVGVPALAMTCDRLIGPLVPGGALAAWAAAAVGPGPGRRDQSMAGLPQHLVEPGLGNTGPLAATTSSCSPPRRCWP